MVTIDSNNQSHNLLTGFLTVSESIKVEEALKQKEKALEESEEKYRKLFETSNDGFWWTDENGYVLETNGGLEEMLGYDHGELKGKFWAEVVADADWAYNAHYQWAKLKSEKSNRYDMKLMTKDGRVLWVRINDTRIVDENGEYNGILAAFRDITETKYAQDAILESEKKALRLVEELKEVDRNKNEFISILSHELRNPLASVSTGISLLEMTNHDNKNSNTITILKRQVKQLSNLVDDLLDITRITNKKMIVKKQDMVLNTVIRNAIDDIRSEFNSKGVELIEEIQLEPIVINADSSRLTQCVDNILSNALKFTNEKGKVIISLYQEKNYAVIIIKDNGIGISSEMLPLIFNPFSQDYNTNQNYNNRGLGLGLAIVKDIIELHQGKVNISSEGLGKGTEFTMKVPIINRGNK